MTPIIKAAPKNDNQNSLQSQQTNQWDLTPVQLIILDLGYDSSLPLPPQF